jgi:hypothetical protein
VRLEPPIPKHQISPDQVRRVVGKNERDVATCYEGRKPNSEKVQVKLVIEPSGQVSDVAIPGVSPDISECLAVKIRAWKFPSFGGDTAQRIVVPVVVVRGRA